MNAVEILYTSFPRSKGIRESCYHHTWPVHMSQHRHISVGEAMVVAARSPLSNQPNTRWLSAMVPGLPGAIMSRVCNAFYVYAAITRRPLWSRHCEAPTPAINAPSPQTLHQKGRARTASTGAIHTYTPCTYTYIFPHVYAYGIIWPKSAISYIYMRPKLWRSTLNYENHGFSISLRERHSWSWKFVASRWSVPHVHA